MYLDTWRWQGLTWYRIYSDKFYWFSTYYPEQTKSLRKGQDKAKAVEADGEYSHSAKRNKPDDKKRG